MLQRYVHAYVHCFMFPIAKLWIQPAYWSTDEWMQQGVCVHRVLLIPKDEVVSFVGKWMKLEVVILRKKPRFRQGSRFLLFVFVYETYILYTCVYNMYLEGD